MSARRALRRLGPRLLLSYLLVAAVGIGCVVVFADLVGPSLFDRALARHVSSRHGQMGSQMTEEMQRATLAAFRTTIFQSLLLAMGVATVAAVLISLYMTRWITRPISRMAQLSRQIAAGDYSARAPITRPDELADLGASLNRMAQALAETEQRRTRLIGDVAHEIRTPLTTLRGNLEGMLDGVIEPTPELLRQLYDESTRLNRLVEDLGELARVEPEALRLDLRPISPAGLVTRVAANVADSCSMRQIDLLLELPEELPDVLADADRVAQVLMNLLVNALRYTPAGGSVTISGALDQGMVTFAVRDTGTGMEREHLEHVFERFYRADPARSRNHGGSGIGLTISQAIVEAHGGTITAESPGLGHGSTVRFSLPAATS